MTHLDEIKSIAYLVSAIFFIMGIKKLGAVRTARQGNFYAALGMFIAVFVTLFGKLQLELIIAGFIIGASIGAIMAWKVQMTGMPQMVAVLNGFGGIASLLVAAAEFSGNNKLELTPSIAAVLSIFIGGLTFTGSFIAFGKLQGFISEKAVVFPAQHLLNLILIFITVAIGALINTSPEFQSMLFGHTFLNQLDPFETMLITIIVLSLILGILVVIPIGGADMPVVISLLNSYSGMAAATTGFVLGNMVLIITGALVGASGIILTQIMCKSMNRSLLNVLLGGFGQTSSASNAPAGAKSDIVVKQIGVEECAMLFDSAATVVVVPGYGMAVAQAQHVVRELMELLEKKGANVRFAIHPVAGRMPGHMNVLLAEANVDYDKLLEMDDINDDFPNTDIALVIGANDVTNPAARHDNSSPIFGMPILNVDKARTVIVIKRSLNPGYAGIDNELYGYPNCLMYLGDAKSAIANLISELKENM